MSTTKIYSFNHQITVIDQNIFKLFMQEIFGHQELILKMHRHFFPTELRKNTLLKYHRNKIRLQPVY